MAYELGVKLHAFPEEDLTVESETPLKRDK